ncbi:MAG: hypothetical protein ONA90_11280 [candidate division KSB1 bacterium]|nr:hypothetical protein [candidate division KSB1 bacterium]
MHRHKIFAVSTMALLLAGCVVPSLHPLFTEADLVFDPNLIGTWAKEGEENTWTFQKGGGKAYDFIYTEKGTPAQFEAHLVRLDKFLFLDTYPEEPDIDNDLYKLHLIPAHHFFRIWITGDTLRLAALDPDWLKNMIDQKKVNIAHERVEDTIVLTAPTKALQEFVLKYAEDAEAFSDPTEIYRQK